MIFNLLKLSITFFILFVIIGISVGCTAGLFLLRKHLAENVWNGDKKQILTVLLMAMAQAAVVFILDLFAKPIIKMLTKFENHKTRSKFEQHYVLKMFIFRFLNNYASIFWIAFGKQHVEGCIDWDNYLQSEANDCMTELKYQLIFLFSIYIVLNIFEIAIPFCRKCKSETRFLHHVSDVHQYSDEQILKEKVEVELYRSSYDEGEIDGTVEDYSELMVQFGFVALFSIAFPLIPLLAFVNNIFEMLIDRYRVMNLTRRSVPARAKGHGIFNIVFGAIAFLAIFTNIGIMAFTGYAFK